MYGYVDANGESDFTISVFKVEILEHFRLVFCNFPEQLGKGLEETVFIFKTLSSLDRGTHEDPVIGLFVLFSTS